MIWVRTLLFALTFVATSLVLIPRWILDSSGDPAVVHGAWPYLGVIAIASGAALMLWSWRDFAVRGRGTPAPFDAPRHLVVAGPYRYVRNPMYIAAGLVVLGEAAYFGSIPLLMYAAFGALAVHAFVVAYEEPVLARRFGAEYDAYRRDVHRWLPRLPRREP